MNNEKISQFEQIEAQLQSIYFEIGTLSKKKPDDAVNEFKIQLTNEVLSGANEVLSDDRRPFRDFLQFQLDDVPTNSDVAVILSQYLNCMEKLRADKVRSRRGRWYWLVDGEISALRAAPPRKLKW